MDDNGSSIVIAGLLCLLLTGFLCCGEPPPAPVSDAGRAGVEALAANGARGKHKRARRAAPRMKPAREGGNQGGGSDTHTSSGGGRARV